MSYQDYFDFPIRGIGLLPTRKGDFVQERWFPGEIFKSDTYFDDWGVGHESGSEAAFHMTRMLHPLASAKTISELTEYPFPDWHDQPSVAQGGLLPCPTHLLEPEVPWANIDAYITTCRTWQG